ncbi:MAG: hypothetical protein ACD_18C00064G0012 [uncultured bacterium]|nr:MAG: hypothetical protein ACD_18C00064G0012 [uncultured bacterium]OGH90664.1 MAG: hypothetical protein A2507_01885 [Candidatus Magasanikbacteria bacterium RIFOXYD12_FULL_33_17]HAO52304.1 hypothetical protein [Candidatus Magasanikbacteria bacterium]
MNRFLKSSLFILFIFSVFIFFTDVYAFNERYCITPKAECFAAFYSVLEKGVEVQKDFSSQCLTGGTVFNDVLTCNNFLTQNFTFCLTNSSSRICDLVYKAVCSSENGKQFDLSTSKPADYYLNSCKKELGHYNWTMPSGNNSIYSSDSIEFTIKAECENYCSDKIFLNCFNCEKDSVNFISSSTAVLGKDISVNYKFDAPSYLKNHKVDLPTTVSFTFVADNSHLKESKVFNININNINCSDLHSAIECNNTACFWASKVGSGTCVSKTDEKICNNLTTAECSQSKSCSLNSNNKCELKTDIKNRGAVDAVIKSEHPTPDNSLLPECAFTGSCRDVNDLVKLGLVIINYIFSIVAGLAFIMFVYGGFTWIFSFGNSDKVKKGQQIFVYAVIGLVIVFTAYILVGFLLDALNVSQSFRII